MKLSFSRLEPAEVGRFSSTFLGSIFLDWCLSSQREFRFVCISLKCFLKVAIESTGRSSSLVFLGHYSQ